MDIKKRHMYQFGIGISIAGTKPYVELDIAKLPQLAGYNTGATGLGLAIFAVLILNVCSSRITANLFEFHLNISSQIKFQRKCFKKIMPGMEVPQRMEDNGYKSW